MFHKKKIKYTKWICWDLTANENSALSLTANENSTLGLTANENNALGLTANENSALGLTADENSALVGPKQKMLCSDEIAHLQKKDL